jgi:hypothetical protein
MSRTTRWTHAPCGPEEAPSTSPSRQPPLTAHQLLTARLQVPRGREICWPLGSKNSTRRWPRELNTRMGSKAYPFNG